MGLIALNKKTKWLPLIPIILAIAVFVYYNILLDVTLILLLFLTSYCIGSNILLKGNTAQKKLIQTAIGLGILGVIIYFILLLGFGRTSIYIILLIEYFPLTLRKLLLSKFI
jgi:hypothetical protein